MWYIVKIVELTKWKLNYPSYTSQIEDFEVTKNYLPMENAYKIKCNLWQSQIYTLKIPDKSRWYFYLDGDLSEKYSIR